MGSIYVPIGTRRAAQLETKHQQDAIEAAMQAQRGSWDKYQLGRVSSPQQTDTKCKCCGSQEVVHHNKRTICAYYRSSMQ